MRLELHAVFQEVPAEEGGGYYAYVEELPGVNSQGDTLEEARENLLDALELVLEHNRAARPKPTGRVIYESLACA